MSLSQGERLIQVLCRFSDVRFSDDVITYVVLGCYVIMYIIYRDKNKSISVSQTFE